MPISHMVCVRVCVCVVCVCHSLCECMHEMGASNKLDKVYIFQMTTCTDVSVTVSVCACGWLSHPFPLVCTVLSLFSIHSIFIVLVHFMARVKLENLRITGDRVDI